MSGVAGTVTVTDNQSYSSGAYTASISPWGRGKYVEGVNYTESLQLDSNLFPNGVIISSNWPDVAAVGVYDFDSIQFGDYYYTKAASPIEPSRIDDISSLSETHAFTISGATSGFDVIDDLFLTSGPGSSTNILDEMEVFLHAPSYAASFVADSVPIGTLTDDGVQWTVAESKGSTPDLLFMPSNGADVSSGTVDIKQMLDFLVAKGVLSGNDYFNGMAFGSETEEGSGTLNVSSFVVNYTPGASSAQNVEATAQAQTASSVAQPQSTSTYDASGKLLSTETQLADGTHEVATYQVAGQAYTSYETTFTGDWLPTSQTFYKADGSIYQNKSIAYAADGSQTTETYDAFGTLLNQDAQLANGSHQVTTYQVAGQAYTSFETSYTSAWKPTSQIFYAADGSLYGTDTIIYNSDGSQTTNKYDASSRLVSQDLELANGAHQVTNYQIAGEPYTSEQTSYTAEWQPTRQTFYNANGSIYQTETIDYNSDGSQTTEKFDSTGAILRKEVLLTNSSHQITDYQVTGQPYTSFETSFTSGWEPTSQIFYNSDKSDYQTDTITYGSNGLQTTSYFSAAGVLLNKNVQLANGGHDLINYQVTGQPYASVETTFGSNWQETGQIFLNANGSIYNPHA